MAFDIKWIFLPQLIYFIFMVAFCQQRQTKMDIFVYLGLPVALLASALLVYVIASIAGDWDMAGVYIPFSLALMGGICLVSGVVFISLNWGLRKMRGKRLNG